MPKTVLISAPYLLSALDVFAGLFPSSEIDVVAPEVDERLSESELMQFAGDFDGAITGDDQFTAAVLKACAPRLKVISKWGTGIDSIDVEAANRLGIQVYNTPDAFTDAVADTVLGYILSFARELPWMDDAMKAGEWDKREAKALHECTLGIVGVGRIGTAVARRAVSFGMRTLGNDVIEIEERKVEELGITMCGLGELLSDSDYVSLNCDLNPTSHHLIGEDQLNRMAPHAVLINTARGPVVNERALIDALRSGSIRGAALDVFEVEPLPPDSPLRAMDNVLLAPHNANSSTAAWNRVHLNTIRNLFLGLGMKPPAEIEVIEGVW